jgi:hypothetical protein
MTGPILLFGMPRSGTSWLGKIFDSHPGTVYRHEPDTFPRLDAIPMFATPNEIDSHQRFIQEFVAGLPRLNAARYAAKLPLFPKTYRTGLRFQLLRAGALTAKVANKFLPDFPVIGARTDQVCPEPVLVWKSIESLGRFGLIMKSLDNAHGIHLIRHPCGQINSVRRGEAQAAFWDNTPSSEYYGKFEMLLKRRQARRRELTLEAFKRLMPEERLAWQWVLVNEKAVDDVEGMERARLVRYEDLCRDPVATVRALFRFAGLDWNRQTEAFLHRSTHNENKAYYSVFKHPGHAAERWRDELGRETIERIQSIVRQSPLADYYLKDMVSAA